MDKIISWLISGDISIQYQVNRDLLASPEKTTSTIQKKIEHEGWGFAFSGNKRMMAIGELRSINQNGPVRTIHC